MSAAVRSGLVALVCASAILPAAAMGDLEPEAPDGPIESVEQVEEVEVIQAVETVNHPEGDRARALDVFGRLHPALVHLPLGFLVLLVAFELIGLTRRGERLALCGGTVLWASLLVAIPALISGMVRAGEMWPVGAPPELLADHRNAMLAATGAIVAALALRLARRGRLERGWRAAYLALLIAGAIAAGIGGHLGGELVFGEGFLWL